MIVVIAGISETDDFLRFFNTHNNLYDGVKSKRYCKAKQKAKGSSVSGERSEENEQTCTS